MTNKILVACHAGEKSYLDNLIRRRYKNPGIGCQFTLEWVAWSDGKYAVKIFRNA